jgi:hypothetical protein
MKDNPPVPTSSWRTHLLIILLLFILAPVNLISIFPHMSTHIPGDVMDTAEYPLNEWWTAHALLDLKINPFNNTYIFYPLGQNLVQHTYTFLDGLIYTLLRSTIPLIVFHNLVIWMTFFVNAVAAYILIFYFVRIPWLALVGALAFGHCPTLISYYKTACLLEFYNFIFFVLFSYLFVREGRFKWAVPAGLVWGLTLYNYPYYFVFGGIWLLILIGYQLCPFEIQIKTQLEKKGSLKANGIIGVSMVGIILFPVLAPRRLWELTVRWNLINWITLSGVIFLLIVTWTIFRLQALRGKSPPPPPLPSPSEGAGKGWGWKNQFKGDLVLFIKCLPIHWNPLPFREALLLLVFSGLALGMAALIGFPYFLAYFNDAATRVAVGSLPSDFATYSVDLTGFFAPFNVCLDGLYSKIATNWVSGRPIVGTPAFLGYGFVGILCLGIKQFFKRPELRLWLIGWVIFLLLCLGPFLKVHGLIIDTLPLPAYLIRYIPVLESARTLSRYLAPVMLLLCLLICLILKPFFIRCGPWGKKILLTGLFLMVGFEYGLLPYPLSMKFSDYRVPEVYKVLARKAEGRAGLLLDLPLLIHSGGRSAGRGETRRLYYQTVHQQKMIGGVSSKLDESVFVFFQHQPAISKFWSFQAVEENELAALIYAYDINWIVLDKRYYVPEILIAYRSAFNSAPYLKSFYEDSRFVGLAVDSQSPSLKKRALQYWRTPESLSGLVYPGFTRPLKINQPAPLEMIIPKKLWNDLEIEIAPETVRTFSCLRLSIPDQKENELPFPSSSSGKEEGFRVRLGERFPLTSDLPSMIPLRFTPGNLREKLNLDGSPFPFALLSLGQASGFYLTPGQALIDNRHFFIDQRGMTAFRLSDQGKILGKAYFDTHTSAEGSRALLPWLKNFSEKDYLVLLVHDEGSRSFTTEATDLLKEFGATTPLKKGDWQHSYAFLGIKGGPNRRVWEAHTISLPSFIRTPGQVIQISNMRLHLP